MGANLAQFGAGSIGKMSFLLGYWGPDEANPANLRKALDRLGERDSQHIGRPGLEIAFPTGAEVWQAGERLGVLLGTALSEKLLPEAVQTGLTALEQDTADGQYALLTYAYEPGTLTLAHDPFGAQRFYYARQGESLWFSTALRTILALEPFRHRRELDYAALHTYLAFSFVAAPRTLIEGIRVVPPNTALVFTEPAALPQERLLFRLCPAPAPALAGSGARSESEWVARLRAELDRAMTRRLAGPGSGEVAVHLSGGLDSSLVAAWLRRAEVKTRLFHLDFGPPYNAERPYAESTAAWLGLPLTNVPVGPDKGTGQSLRRMVWRMGEPWGDPVTLPLYQGYAAVAQAGLPTVFNGEGGDQLFAGWPNRAMLAAQLYGEAEEGPARTERYLQTFHHFYGLEKNLYGAALHEKAGAVSLAALVEPYLGEAALPNLLDRLRWTNFWLKGSQNIMPRAAALARAAHLQMQAPLFDRRLARFALSVPADLLMRGTGEKYLLKRAIAEDGLLPEAILERPKRGMGVPTTEWCQGPLRAEFKKLLGRLGRRGLFQNSYLAMLSRGEDLPGEIRRHRRLGEKIWQLGILEIWLELFLDKVELDEP